MYHMKNSQGTFIWRHKTKDKKGKCLNGFFCYKHYEVIDIDNMDVIEIDNMDQEIVSVYNYVNQYIEEYNKKTKANEDMISKWEMDTKHV
jgi:hypothetical protein